ncbi:unnamed protein product [Zymoseptoria tritici ST99CH_1E4]|uniref:Uncharacterized protein n=1 Tax=Zymoseptoria tritici ST99CH_1E4 TaxID=1276532 RepID=A0A2H1G4R7_ZYMTR|nr:unnamed protein product [Zymoseptoria tritici ST99CH_1E4]
MGAAESKNVQKKEEVGSALLGPGSAREDTTQLAPAVSEDDSPQRTEGLKRRAHGSLSSRRGVKRRRLSGESNFMEETEERMPGFRVPAGAGADLDSQLAEVSTELREALVSLREPEDSMEGWKDAPAPAMPETERQTNRLIVRRVMESLRGVHLISSLSAASLRRSTTTVADYTLPGEVKHFFDNVETRLITIVRPSEPQCQAQEDGNGGELRSAKRRRLDEQGGSGRQHKRRRRSTHTDLYPLRSTGRLRKLTGLWKRDGWRNILKG